MDVPTPSLIALDESFLPQGTWNPQHPREEHVE